MQSLTLDEVADILETADIEHTVDHGHAITHSGTTETGCRFVLINDYLGRSAISYSL